MEDVAALTCEPWFLVEYQDLSWIVEGSFGARAVLVKEGDGTEMLRRTPHFVDCSPSGFTPVADFDAHALRWLDDQGREVGRETTANGCRHILADIVRFIELRLGESLRRRDPPCAKKTMREIVAELEAEASAVRVLNNLIGR